MTNASFSLDAINNSSVAEALGQIFDQCAVAIDAMVKETNMAYSSRDTATSTDTEVIQMDNESTVVISVEILSMEKL
jgi:hypothetical protein